MDQVTVNTENSLAIPPVRFPIGWFEETLPVRGCNLSLAEIKNVYEELTLNNQMYGQEVVAALPRDPYMIDRTDRSRFNRGKIRFRGVDVMVKTGRCDRTRNLASALEILYV